jgi:hypothetical protein
MLFGLYASLQYLVYHQFLLLSLHKIIVKIARTDKMDLILAVNLFKTILLEKIMESNLCLQYVCIIQHIQLQIPRCVYINLLGLFRYIIFQNFLKKYSNI